MFPGQRYLQWRPIKTGLRDNWRADAGLGKMASPRPGRKAAIIETGTTVTVAALVLAAVVFMAGLVLFGLRGLGTRLKDSDERVVRGLDSIRDSVTSVTGTSQATLVQVSQNLGDLRRSSEGLLLETRRLGELRDAFRLPAPRGGIGELMLENLLRACWGPGSTSCSTPLRTDPEWTRWFVSAINSCRLTRSFRWPSLEPSSKPIRTQIVSERDASSCAPFAIM